MRGLVDGQPFQRCLMALGDGRHKLPIKTELSVGNRKEAQKPE